MSIEERIPEMSEAQLESFRANALRLSQSGTDRQRTEAERLLPQIETALVERKRAKADALAERRKAAPKRVATRTKAPKAAKQ